MLHQVARQINQSLAAQSKMKIGDVRHPSGHMVRVVEGCYLDPIYGRVSNFWYWHRINDDGSLGPQECGYGW